MKTSLKSLAAPLLAAALTCTAFAGAGLAQGTKPMSPDTMSSSPMMADCLKKASMETDAMKREQMTAACNKEGSMSSGTMHSAPAAGGTMGPETMKSDPMKKN
jgi:pentapeptide MXKDX repeat protein